jgi:hypothetical protein
MNSPNTGRWRPTSVNRSITRRAPPAQFRDSAQSLPIQWVLRERREDVASSVVVHLASQTSVPSQTYFHGQWSERTQRRMVLRSDPAWHDAWLQPECKLSQPSAPIGAGKWLVQDRRARIAVHLLERT